MEKYIFKLLGYLKLIAAALLLIVMIFILPKTNDTIIYPKVIEMALYCTLLIFSGLGIILVEKKLFVFTFYLYTFLGLNRIVRIHEIITSEKIGPNLDKLYSAIKIEVLTVGCFMVILILLGLFMLNRDILNYYNINKKKDILVHIPIAVLLFLFLLIIL